MKEPHFHGGISAFLFAGISAVLFIQGLRLVSAIAIARGGTVGDLGKAVGGTVNFTGAATH